MSETPRRLVHTRSIRVEAYRREDGYFDLEADIQDVKPHALELESGTREGGAPVHDMQLTVTIDLFLNVVAVQARTLASPYPGTCDSFSEAYQQLVGLNLLRGFRAAVKERLGGTLGCTHLTELAGILPTAAVQAFAGEVMRLDPDSETMPPQLDRCRALRRDGPVVARFYPRWHRVEGERT